MKRKLLTCLILLLYLKLAANNSQNKNDLNDNLTENNKNKIIDNFFKSFFHFRILKQYEKANEALGKILELDKNLIHVYLFLSEINYLDGHWKEGIRYAKKYLEKTDISDKKNYFDISWAYFLLGEIQNAMDFIINSYKENSELIRNNTPILLNTLSQKGIYHSINNENLMFQNILTYIFTTIFAENFLYVNLIRITQIAQKTPFYRFQFNRLKNLEIQFQGLNALNQQNKFGT